MTHHIRVNEDQAVQPYTLGPDTCPGFQVEIASVPRNVEPGGWTKWFRRVLDMVDFLNLGTAVMRSLPHKRNHDGPKPSHPSGNRLLNMGSERTYYKIYYDLSPYA
jgi:hypothetical protein